MLIRLWDIQSGFGGAQPGVKALVESGDLLAAMDRLEIERALVRILPADLDVDIERSNTRLISACDASRKRLIPCPIVAPNGAGDLADETEQVDRAITAGAAAVWLRPDADHWLMSDWCAGQLMRTLAARRLPAIISAGALTLDTVAQMAGAHPLVPFLLIGLDYRSQRSLVPLLQAFNNIYLSIGSNYTVTGGVEQICRTVGAGRLLFGSGYPNVEPAAAVGTLLYAAISTEEKELIGYENMRRLQEGIQ